MFSWSLCYLLKMIFLATSSYHCEDEAIMKASNNAERIGKVRKRTGWDPKEKPEKRGELKARRFLSRTKRLSILYQIQKNVHISLAYLFEIGTKKSLNFKKKALDYIGRSAKIYAKVIDKNIIK